MQKLTNLGLISGLISLISLINDPKSTFFFERLSCGIPLQAYRDGVYKCENKLI